MSGRAQPLKRSRQRRSLGRTHRGMRDVDVPHITRTAEGDRECICRDGTPQSVQALRSHAFPPCEVCGTYVDDPEAGETCSGPTPKCAACSLPVLPDDTYCAGHARLLEYRVTDETTWAAND